MMAPCRASPSAPSCLPRTAWSNAPQLPSCGTCRASFLVARIPYAPDGSGQPAGAYDAASYATAARLLGHAGVAAVCWNGTRGAALGLATDRALVATLAAEAGCPATTTAIHTVALLHRLAARRIALVMPGTAAEALADAAGFAAEGITTLATRGLGCPDNLSAAAGSTAIMVAARALAAECAPDAILVWSTNLPGLACMAPLEAELGHPRRWSAAPGVAALLHLAGIDTSPLARLGRVFTAG